MFFFFPVSFRGIHLIETNEEVCVFYEKLNIQGKSVLTVFNHGREAFMFTDSASSGKASLSLHDNRIRYVYNNGYLLRYKVSLKHQIYQIFYFILSS